MSDDKMIRVWRFSDAPEDMRELSENGGDEDWLAHVPASMSGDYIAWLDSGIGGFGMGDVSEYWRPDGSVVFIGSHS